MIVEATIQQTPTPGASDAGLPVQLLSVDGETYADALAQLDAKIPDGWRLLNYRVPGRAA